MQPTSGITIRNFVQSISDTLQSVEIPQKTFVTGSTRLLTQ